MQEVAKKTSMLCQTLQMSFDDKVDEWKEKYD
jgi:hypothetical protein